MARDRLSWDKEKTAEIEKKADPYTMNQTHPNPPASKYDIGGPSQFAEDPDMKKPWLSEGRTETGHPAPAARQAVKAARQMEDKALKCITVAQRMLPGASDELIEDQATDLMFIPENRIMATLERQASFAEVLANGDEEEGKEQAEESGEEAAPAPDNAEEDEKKKKKEDDKEAADPAEEDEKKKEDDKEAADPAEEDEKKKEDDKEAAADPAEEDEKKKEDDKEAAADPAEEDEKKKEDDKEAAASDEIDLSPGVDLLDSIFANEETEKVGAKKLSGIVKKASSDIGLDSLWSSPPDVSEAFPTGKM